MFSAARGIQDWLTDSAAEIARSGEPVRWRTPLGLPVVQPYHRPHMHFVQTPLQRVTIVDSMDDTQSPLISRQRSAFPPNFIHSLDSSHMLMTASACMDHDIHFAAVHDSFWTHAASVGTMNRLLRERFVALHSLDVIEDLHRYFTEQYSGRPIAGHGQRREVHFRPTPTRGRLDLTQILRSDYFFD